MLTVPLAKTAPEYYRATCGLVAALMPHLKWRHSGLGLLQAYVHEGTEREQRIHIWHNDLQQIEGESRLWHDHRFDLHSHILVGSLQHREMTFVADNEGLWQLYKVVHARKALASTNVPQEELVTLVDDMRYFRVTQDFYFNESEGYFYPKREFHGTYLKSPLAVSLLTKVNQDTTPARLVAALGRPPRHAFGEPVEQSLMDNIIERAQAELLNRWQHGPQVPG